MTVRSTLTQTKNIYIHNSYHSKGTGTLAILRRLKSLTGRGDSIDRSKSAQSASKRDKGRAANRKTNKVLNKRLEAPASLEDISGRKFNHRSRSATNSNRNSGEETGSDDYERETPSRRRSRNEERDPRRLRTGGQNRLTRSNRRPYKVRHMNNQGKHNSSRLKVRDDSQDRSYDQSNSTPESKIHKKPRAADTDLWGDITLDSSIVTSLKNMGYDHPSDIQEASIPWQLMGRDVVAQAVTGSGKTASFGIPMCNSVDVKSRDVEGLVLVPTRELAQQVQRELSLIGRDRGIGVVAVYGGEPIAKQIRALDKGMSIVVGTPGRVKDLMNRRVLDLGHVRNAVLDEADEMLDIGFADDMEYILRRTPSQRQTALFSATIPSFIRGLIRKYLNEPRWIQLVNDTKGLETVDEVDQIFYDVASQDKSDGIVEVLDDIDEDSQVLIFRKMQVGVDRLARGLASEGFAIKGIHGGMSQTERNRVMTAFRDGRLKMLVATNLAARGLDIPSISHVINYDMPENIEEYVHRIGRTARMGKRGTAISFIGEWDFELHQQIVDKIGEEKMIQRKFSFY